MGKLLRILTSLIYAILFALAIAITGIYGWFLASLADADLDVATWKKAVIGLAGAVAIYLLLVTIPTCCLGGKKFFSLLAIPLDLLALGAFIAIAVLTRDGADDCDGFVETPLGDGPEDEDAPGFGRDRFGFSSDETDSDLSDYDPDLGVACELNRAAFIMALIGIFLFLLTMLLHLFLLRSHKRSQAYGAAPAKTGYAVPWRSKKTEVRDVEVVETTGTTDAPPIATTTVPNMEKQSHVVRPSGDTAYTAGATNGYYSGPTGTATNAYTYDNTTNTTGTTNY